MPSKNRAAIIAFAGRRGTQRQTRMLVRHGYGVLLFDRRGEGESEGDPNIFGWQGERDVHAAVDYLRSRADVDPDRIGGIGLSVGGEMMIEAAAESDGLAAIVSEGRGSFHTRGPRHGRVDDDEVARGRARARGRDAGSRALLERPAAAEPRGPRAADRASARVLRLRDARPGR